MPFSGDARRARLARRHALHPDFRAPDPVAATRAVVALHATEPHSVHLAVAARTGGTGADAVERALYADRAIVKQLAMRRTLFGAPRDLLPALLGGPSARVAAQVRALVARDVERHGLARDGEAWVARAGAAVVERLADGAALPARQLREELPELQGHTAPAPGGKEWDVSVPFAPRVLALLGAEGRIVRGENDGHWRTSRPRWTLMETWLGERPEPLDTRAAPGRAGEARHLLHTHLEHFTRSHVSPPTSSKGS